MYRFKRTRTVDDGDNWIYHYEFVDENDAHVTIAVNVGIDEASMDKYTPKGKKYITPSVYRKTLGATTETEFRNVTSMYSHEKKNAIVNGFVNKGSDSLLSFSQDSVVLGYVRSANSKDGMANAVYYDVDGYWFISIPKISI